MGRTCFCPGCKTGYRSFDKLRKKEGGKTISLFNVPKNPYYFELWQKAIPRADRLLRPQDVVCEKHFKEEDILTFYETKLPDGTIHRLFRGRKNLEPTAIPCIFSDVPGHSSYEENKLTKPKKKCLKIKKVSQTSNILKKSRKEEISCPDNETNKKNDSSGQKENVLLEVIVVHPIPEKPPTAQSSFLKERQNAETAENSLLSDSQDHFTSEPDLPASEPDETTENNSSQIDAYKIVTESRTPDKLTVNYSKHSSSIKTITESFVPDALTENSSDQNNCNMMMIESPACDSLSVKYSDLSDCDKTLTEFSTDNEPKENCPDQIISGKGLTESTNIVSESVLNNQVSFDFLKANVSMFETSNSWWRVNIFEDFIAFSRWTPDYTIERRIVVTKDLAVKVYLKDRETSIGSDLKELSILDITKLIYKVENLKMCDGVDKKDRNCAGFLQGVFMCKRYNACLNCIKWFKEEKKKAVKRLKVSGNCVELLNFNLI